MPDPSNKAERICAMFDSYCKTVLRNASKNEKRALANRKKREIVTDERIQIDAIRHEDTYPSTQLVIREEKFSCVISSDKLYMALLSLPENQRVALILDFWYRWKDEKIAIYLNVTPRTVYNLRQNAFKAIRRYYENRGEIS